MKESRLLPLCLNLIAFNIGAWGMSSVWAGGFSKDAIGTTGGQFLELPVGARGVAMGSAQGANAEDASAVYYNPANLAGLAGTNVTFMHALYFQEIFYDFAAVAIPTENHGTIAIGAQYMAVGSLDKMDNTGNLTGESFAPRDLAVSFVNARKTGDLEYGYGVKYISSKLNNTANAYAADVGIRWLIKPAALSLSVSNLGTGLKFRTETAPLPTSLRFGSAYKYLSEMSGNLMTITLDGLLVKSAAFAVCAGLEYKMAFINSMALSARVGYNSRISASGLGGTAGFSAGTGFDINRFSVDYAFTPFGDLGNSHRISLSMKFGKSDDYEIQTDVYSRNIQSIKSGGNNGLINFKPGSEAIVKVGKAKLYSHSDAGSRVLAELEKGEDLEVVKQMGDWIKVTASSGKTGWLPKSVLRISR